MIICVLYIYFIYFTMLLIMQDALDTSLHEASVTSVRSVTQLVNKELKQVGFTSLGSFASVYFSQVFLIFGDVC